jgi:hypothetical protein
MRYAFNVILAAAVLGGCGAYSMVEQGELRGREVRRMLARTAATRGLPLPERLDTRVIQRDELPQLLTRMFHDEWTEEELRAAQTTLAALGLWPGGLDLLAESIRLQGGEIAGLYSPQRRTLYVVEGAEAPQAVKTASAMSGRDLFVEFVLAHEIIHALQHQAFPRLFEITAEWKDQDDAVLALHAAIEGDALRYGFEVVSPDAPLPPVEQFVETQELDPQDARRIPALLRETLIFPYGAGYPLSLAEGKHLLARPPVSTEQVLHPAKRREAFASFDLSALQDVLPRGCRPVSENTAGELLISILLRDLDGSIDAGAWEGWDGDRYLVADCEGRPEFVWATAWDSEADAAEFAAAYAAIAAAVQSRAGLAAAPRVAVAAAEARVFTGGFATLAESIDAHARRTRVANLADLIANKALIGRAAVHPPRATSHRCFQLDIPAIP